MTDKNSRIPRTKKPGEIKVLIPQKGLKSRSPIQAELDLKITMQKEIDGVGMGVLSDGTPFLNGRGLARLCGVDSSRISEMGNDWQTSVMALTSQVKALLSAKGVNLPKPYIEVGDRGQISHAFPDVLCVAVLEYYAFDAPNPREEAKRNFRLLAGKALRDFIYTQVGYDPNELVPDVWRQFHDRVSLTYNAVPAGYFGVFKEIADMIVTLGQSGLHIDSKFIPDGSVGSLWSTHWSNGSLQSTYGERTKFEHNYPDYFPQAASNPQDAWCYPEAALGEFRRWFRETYIGQGKFKNYIQGKVKRQELPPSFAQIALVAYEKKKLS